jgi:hypothetical protein
MLSQSAPEESKEGLQKEKETESRCNVHCVFVKLHGLEYLHPRPFATSNSLVVTLQEGGASLIISSLSAPKISC